MGIGYYSAKFLVGGALVCVFALVSEVFAPKRFAGIFSAAPSVLTAGLAVTLVAETAGKTALDAEGAAAGAIGLIAFCIVATPLVRRFKALGGSLLAALVWLGVAMGAYGALAGIAGR
ncbi:MAG TPA: DUF3147 family protein [Ktedonobacterales bacterium]|nr:DUF3147 family protein [Ktedonobacterales bacterium]